MACGWEGNRRSGVAQAMRHRLQWFIHLRAHGLRQGDEHPAYAPRGVWHLNLIDRMPDISYRTTLQWAGRCPPENVWKFGPPSNA